MKKFMIQLSGDLMQDERFGQTYYAMNKKGELNYCGITAPERTKKRFNFLFDEETAKAHGIDYLHREYVEDEK